MITYAFPPGSMYVTSFTSSETRAVSMLATLYIVRMLGLFMVLPLIAIYSADMTGATPFLLGLAVGAYGLTQATLQIPMGWLSDRIDRRWVIVFGLCFFVKTVVTIDSLSSVCCRLCRALAALLLRLLRARATASHALALAGAPRQQQTNRAAQSANR